MTSHNSVNKTVTHDDLMDQYETAFNKIKAISEDHPEKARRLYARLASKLLELMQHQVKAFM